MALLATRAPAVRALSSSPPADGVPRLLFVDHTTEPGGAELALARFLASPAAPAATVVVPQGRPGVYGAPGIRCLQAGPPQRPGAARAGAGALAGFGVALLAQARALRSAGAFRSATVVVANTSRAALYTALACAGTGKPFGVHLRDAVTRESLGPVGLVLMRAALRRADVVVANSRYTLSLVEGHLKASARTAVVASPTGVARRSPVPTEPGPVRRVGMVARLDAWKGHALLLQAFAQAFPGSDVELYLAGSSALAPAAYLEELERLAHDLGIAERTHFVGHVSDVSAFIDGMDIGVQCSLRPEPLGQNVLQYLARRCPVVVSAEGGPVEWVTSGGNGMHFAPRDADSLAAALLRVADDTELRGRVRSGAHVGVPDDEQLVRMTACAFLRHDGCRCATEVAA